MLSSTRHYVFESLQIAEINPAGTTVRTIHHL